uniref:Uncharacterized protein n=1 Tax=Megaselia scalaris TaxID=36166 RepID=T1GXN3_MEGSC
MKFARSLPRKKENYLLALIEQRERGQVRSFALIERAGAKIFELQYYGLCQMNTKGKNQILFTSNRRTHTNETH